MDIQQAVALAVVAVAGVYLARLGWDSWKAMWSGRSGCGSGCGKCVMGQVADHRRGRVTDSGARSTAVIPLTTIRPASHSVPRHPSSKDE